jgi:hypothetical protein
MLVESEMLALALVAGVGAAIVGVGLVRFTGVRIDSPRLAAIIPLSVVIAFCAALLPAIGAGRGSTVQTIRGRSPKANDRRRMPQGGSITLMAIRDLIGGWLAEALLGLGVVLIGAVLLGEVVLISRSFQGQLDATVLGTYLSAQVEPFHVVLAVLTLVVASIAVAEVIGLSYLERQPQMAVLRSIGWSSLRLAQFLCVQVLVLSLAAGFVAASIVFGSGLLLGASATVSVEAGLAAAGTAVVCIAFGISFPLWVTIRTPPARALRGE